MTVQQGATIAADAKANGNGGRVAVLSDLAAGTTQMDGAISARGGPQGGDGGWVETSGFALGMGSSAAIDVGAQASSGRPGSWLLDPFDIAITTSDKNTTPDSGGTFTASGDPATIAASTLESVLDSGDVIVSTSGSGSASGDIRVLSPITWSSRNSLTLSADNDIATKAAITGNSGSFFLSAGNTTSRGSIVIRAPISAGAVTLVSGSDGSISERGEGAINTSGLLTTRSATGTTLNGKNTAASFTAVNSTAGNISLTNAGSLTVFGVSNSSGDRVRIKNTGDLTIAGSLDAGSGKASLMAIGGLLTIGAPVSGGNVALRTDNLSINGSVSAPGGTVAIAPVTTSRGMSLDTVRDAMTLSLLQSESCDGGQGFLFARPAPPGE